MKTKSSMNRTLLLYQTLLAVVSIILAGSIWIYSQYTEFQREAITVRKNYLTSQRDLIENEVAKVVDFIHYKQAQSKDRMKSSIKSRVYEAHAVALSIYEKNKTGKPISEIRKMIWNALRPIRFNQGRGYYFATNLNGTQEMHADRTELEGKDLLSVFGGRHESVVRDMIELVQHSGEGFYEYTWTKPGQKGGEHPKISFVKLFEPGNCLIGTGDYLEDVERDLQREIIERIEQISFGKDGVVFAVKWDGTGVAGPGRGKSMIELTDNKGTKIVRELIELSKQGGGYLEYATQDSGETKSVPKLVYVAGIEDWQWYVGAEVFMDEIEKVLMEQKRELDLRTRRNILAIAPILFGAIVLACGISLHTARKTAEGFEVFSSFFKRAAHELTPIEPEAARFSEFDDLVGSANQMIFERKRIEDAHKLDELRLEALLRLSRMDGATLEEIAGHAVEEAVRLTQSKIGYMALLNTEQTVLIMHTWSKSAKQECRMPDITFHYPVETTGLWGEAVRQRRAIITNDYAAPNPWKRGVPEGHVAIQRHMNVPVFEGDRIVIVAGVGNKETEYDEGDVRQLTLLMSGMWSITERKWTEEAIRSSEERYRILFNSGNDAVFVCHGPSKGLPGRFIEVNDIACKRLGYTRDELLQMTPLDIDAADVLPRIQRVIEQIETHGHALWEGAHMTKDGRRIPVEINNQLFDLNGSPIILSTVRDITERKRAEEEKEKLEARLRQAQKMEAIGTLAGGIAHDFNNILAAIMGYTEMVLDDILPGTRAQHDLEQVLKASHRAKDLVKQILAFSRQGDTQERHPMMMGPVVKEALRLLRATLPSTIELRQEIRADRATVLADPTQIHQVVVNLCTNGAHAMRGKGGILEVGLVNMELDADRANQYPGLQPGRYLRLSVVDTGHGMDSSTIERIFDPYFTTKEVGEGSGLGLAVVHGIVQRHQGAITAHSEPGKGTTFHVLFPQVETSQKAERTDHAPVCRGSEHVLFVDDEEMLVSLAKKMLEQLSYKVTATNNSLEAMDLFRANPDAFDLVITDYTMPLMTGVDLAREILLIRPDLPIILCTGFSESITAEKARELGIRAFALKPISRRNISEVIRTVLEPKVCS